jgi:CBS domain-containing protein
MIKMQAMSNLDVPIKEIMSEKLLTLHPKDKLERCMEFFEEFHIHHIPVVVMNEVVGIISQGDILFLKSLTENRFDEFYQDNKLNVMLVEEIMTSNPICIDHEAMLGKAVDLMTENKINALPVTEGKELRGLLTTHDILRYLAKIL